MTQALEQFGTTPRDRSSNKLFRRKSGVIESPPTPNVEGSACA